MRMGHRVSPRRSRSRLGSRPTTNPALARAENGTRTTPGVSTRTLTVETLDDEEEEEDDPAVPCARGGPC